MAQIKVMLLKSSSYLYALMNKLIKLFCRLITSIFEKIKSKLLFYLGVVQKQIFIDYMYLYLDLQSIIKLILDLKSEFDKYIEISDLVYHLVNQLLKTLNILKKDNSKLKELNDEVNGTKRNVDKLKYIFSYKNLKISEIVKDLTTIKLENSIELTPDKNEEIVMNLKMDLRNLQKDSSTIINMKIDLSTISKFNKSQESIKNISDMIDMADIEVSKEIISIILQLNVLETINLFKLNLLITKIQMLYEIILLRAHLINCTIEFHNDLIRNMSELFELMEFDCTKVSEFLISCCKVEKYISTRSKNISDLIKKLGEECKRCKGCIFRKQPIDSFIKLIQVISILKFYVDLIAREILIFKMIILNLIVMSVSSVFIDELIKLILNIAKVEDAIGKLMAVDVYLRAFYTIQVENTLSIVGLSSALKFSQAIHGHYDVLIINLYLINRLIWIIECYIIPIIIYNSKCDVDNTRL